MEDKVKSLQRMIDESNNIVFFGGAGVSTESGIPDFRGKNGLYNKKSDYTPEYLLSSNCFFNNTKLFYDYYKKNMNSLKYDPNITHKYLVKLEISGKLKAIITQNIDGLHTKAGSKIVYEIHGSVLGNHCIKCEKFYDANYIFNSTDIPKCECGGLIKPDVVLYGEMLPSCFDDAIISISKCDMLIVAGTSLKVQPACGLINFFKGKYLVIINNDSTEYDNKANLIINDKLGNVFGKLVVK